MAAGQGGWLRPALGLRLLLATAFQAVSATAWWLPRAGRRARRRRAGARPRRGRPGDRSIRNETWQAADSSRAPAGLRGRSPSRAFQTQGVHKVRNAWPGGESLSSVGQQ
ncbi:hypothetical protein NN561_007835 [Cricetulus griseus]